MVEGNRRLNKRVESVRELAGAGYKDELTHAAQPLEQLKREQIRIELEQATINSATQQIAKLENTLGPIQSIQDLKVKLAQQQQELNSSIQALETARAQADAELRTTTVRHEHFRKQQENVATADVQFAAETVTQAHSLPSKTAKELGDDVARELADRQRIRTATARDEMLSHQRQELLRSYEEGQLKAESLIAQDEADFQRVQSEFTSRINAVENHSKSTDLHRDLNELTQKLREAHQRVEKSWLRRNKQKAATDVKTLMTQLTEMMRLDLTDADEATQLLERVVSSHPRLHWALEFERRGQHRTEFNTKHYGIREVPLWFAQNEDPALRELQNRTARLRARANQLLYDVWYFTTQFAPSQRDKVKGEVRSQFAV